MNTPLRRGIMVALLLGFTLAAGSACTVEELPPPVYADGTAPPLYDGYVVYYDDIGRPYYYTGGVAVWIPPTSPHYHGFVTHWTLHGSAFRSWSVHHGSAYRGYHFGPAHPPGRGGGPRRGR